MFRPPELYNLTKPCAYIYLSIYIYIYIYLIRGRSPQCLGPPWRGSAALAVAIKYIYIYIYIYIFTYSSAHPNTPRRTLCAALVMATARLEGRPAKNIQLRRVLRALGFLRAFRVFRS